MQTIAQQLKVTKFPFIIKDSKGKEIYFEHNSGYWHKREYDSKGNEIYFEDSDGDWFKCEYDSNGNRIYHENGRGYIRDNRPKQKEYTMDEIAKSLGINVSQLKIKK